MLYSQNGDRIVTIDSVTSFHPVYFSALSMLSATAEVAADEIWICLLSARRIRGFTGSWRSAPFIGHHLFRILDNGEIDEGEIHSCSLLVTQPVVQPVG